MAPSARHRLGLALPRERGRLALWCVVALWLLLAAQPALAQDTPPSSSAASSRSPAILGPIREQEPVHFRDKDGNLVPVLGYTLADFDNFIDLKNQLGRGQMRPRYTLQRITAQGKSGDRFAELRIEYEVQITAAGWVRVPLRLGEGILLEQAKYDGPTRHFLEFEGPSPGYAAWLLGKGDDVHRLELRVLAPVETIAGKHRLRLTVPRSTQSELKLTVPLAQAEASVTGGAMLDRASQRVIDGKFNELVLRALDGELNLTWWPPSRAQQEATPDLEAVGTILAHIDGRSFRSDATFLVRSAGGEYRFDRFRVRLPQGTQLVAYEQPGIRITAPAADAKQPIAEVLLDEPTVGPVEVQLLTQRSPTGENADELLELAGFEVLDAVRQWGHIGVRVEEEWQVSWGERHPGVRRVENEALPDSLEHDNLVAGFEYAGQPSSLPARILQRQTRIAVEPEYEIHVGPTRLHLKARLKYRVPGAKVFGVEVDLRDWETEGDRIGPASLVDQDQVSAQLVTPLAIPLRQPTKGDFEITIEAWRNLPAGIDQVEFHLPHPTAHNLVLGPVVLLPADNVALTPKADALVGLKSQPVPRKYSSAGRQQEPLFFLGDVVQGKFAGSMTILPRAVTVNVATNISLDEREARVEERLAYRVLHEPLDRVQLEAPRSVAENNQLEVIFAGRQLPVVSASDDVTDPASPVKLSALLTDEDGKLSEQIGAFEVVVRYPVVREKLLPDVSTSLDVPLVMPLDGVVGANQATVSASSGVNAQPRESKWRVLDSARDRLDQVAALRLSAQERVDVVPLALHLEAASAAASTIVQRCWIQTQLSNRSRQDRAVYRFTSNETSLSIGLPKRVVFKDLTVLLNGQTATYKIGADRRILVTLAKENASRPQLLELQYHFIERDGRLGSQTFEAPLLDPDVWVQRTYWQVVTPPHEHAVGTPAGFIGEFDWNFNGLYFGRHPLLTQSQLEQWCGDETLRRPSLPAGSNIYLFSALGGAPQLPLWTAGRTSLVFVASLSILLAGMLLIYVPRLRTALALVMICAVAGLGLSFPEPVLILLQAGSMGLALVLVALLLERAVAPRRPRLAPVRRGASSIIDRALVHSPAAQVVSSAPSTTRTVAMAAPAPSSSPEPMP